MGDVAAAISIQQQLEDRDGATGTWIHPPDVDAIHHSIEFDGYEHRTRCGEVFDEAPFNVFMDASDIPEHWPVCQECLEGDRDHLGGDGDG